MLTLYWVRRQKHLQKLQNISTPTGEVIFTSDLRAGNLDRIPNRAAVIIVA
jgi:hypothetical protein